ncbi:MAG: tRNA uridine-5-carboxymethylaminomethyl(34) synthesis enzyme MnmG [Planctomycetota bacterium]
MQNFEVIVVGGGHAGCEAALAAARMGASVALISLSRATVGALSCNPAMGGVGKGQLVREIDALGGEMGRATDDTALSYRMLNTSKGEAVQSLRAQVDKVEYPRRMQRALANEPRVVTLENSVEDIRVEAGRVTGVVLFDGSVVNARCVILTNGTFLRGLMHTGERKASGGRIGEAAAQGLSQSLLRHGFETGRLKTGTPPRLAAETIDWSLMVPQHGDPEPTGFSHFLSPPRRTWHPCYVTRTNEQVHDVIRRNLHRSPMYSGVIEGVGPRYCPSIEDKVVRFPMRSNHVVHLEPESLHTNSIYVNGVSTSLPAEVQEELIRAIPGLERAAFLRHGYAVEYDFFPPHQIELTFESRVVRGLYLAGQICGTSGYEEAGAQGLMAGINAVLALRNEPPFVLRRDEAYIGVLADDLVRCDPREPYRMFTARAEYRLLLRHDNADLRLMEKGAALGLVRTEAADRVRAKRGRVEETLAYLRGRRVTGEPLTQRLTRPNASFADLFALDPSLGARDVPLEIQKQVVVEARYEHYISRQREEVERMRRMEAWVIPTAFAYDQVRGLRKEAHEKLARFRPPTLAHARRLAGVTPADLSILMVSLRAGQAALAGREGAAGE